MFKTDDIIATLPSDEENCIRIDVEAAVSIVNEVLGGGASLEMTGGNCAAITAMLEGGDLMYVTDGDVFCYSDGRWQSFWKGWRVGIYSEASEYSETRFWAVGPLFDCTAQALRETLVRALKGGNDTEPDGFYD